ncbi:hypothetical protein ACHQM5_006321 [Ranunculus cassubicifolius]
MVRASVILFCLVALTLLSLGTCAGDAKPNCCKQCFCTKSFPPQCRCTDIKSYCDSTCKACRCTRSIPPQCSCSDIKDHCAPRCPI